MIPMQSFDEIELEYLSSRRCNWGRLVANDVKQKFAQSLLCRTTSGVIDFDRLQKVYKIININEVQTYLHANTDLAPTLEIVAGKLSKFAEVRNLSLEHAQDPSDGWQTMAVTVNTDIDDVEENMKLWRKYLSSAFYPLSEQIGGRLTLLIR